MDLLISFFLAALIFYFRNNKKIGQKQLAHIIGLTVVIYVVIRIVKKFCVLSENFENEEYKNKAEDKKTQNKEHSEDSKKNNNSPKYKSYHCGKCQTQHDQENDLYIPHRALVTSPVTEEDRNSGRDKRLQERNNLEATNKKNNLKINPKVLKAMKEHNSKGTSRQLTTGLEKNEDGETNVNINVSYNISENILAEVQELKDSVNSFLKPTEQTKSKPKPSNKGYNENTNEITNEEEQYLQGAVKSPMFKHMEATNNAGKAKKLSAAQTRKLVKGVRSPDAEEQPKHLPGYSYVPSQYWTTTNKPPKKSTFPISNERDKHLTGKVAPRSSGQFFELA